MPASLTTEMGLKGPQVMISTLTKHYFGASIGDDDPNKELLYRQAFTLFKSFLETSTRHTVEELQQFSNIRTPSPYWVHAPRVLVPLVCCDQAAIHLIAAVGGEESAKKVFGGIKWWQVRGVKGIDAQWISQRKDWQEAKRRKAEKEADVARVATISKGKGQAIKEGEFGEMNTDGAKGKEKEGQEAKPTEDKPEPDYTPDMDEMRCMLYLHGGGYYFGSVDQQRFVIQRYARKMNGRVFAINYRLAPQYPFPCAIQDAIAAYIFLIRPPKGAKHTPVPPSNIVIAGDSAGGGLTLAVLQVIRDSGLPAPAGAVLISPWVDLTHSFPSIHINTGTDIVPPTGLSMHKPSLLWPPPNEETTKNVRNNLAEKIRRFTKIGHSRAPSHESVAFNTRGDVTLPSPISMSAKANKSVGHLKVPDVGKSREPSSSKDEGRSQTPGLDLRPSMSTSALNSLAVATMHRTEPSESFTIQIADTLYQIKSQIQIYATNNNLTHPLVSPVNAYLGGLPPLYIMAGDKEVLRDEILFLAHKAVHPDRYPLRPDLRAMNPLMDGIKERFPNPTQVHLQVYDETCHVLPLFTFTTPAKYAFRSVATFCKHVIPDKTMFTPVQMDLSLPSFSFDSPAKRSDSGMVRSPSFKLTGFLARGSIGFTRSMSTNRKNSMMASGSTPASPTTNGDVGPRFQRDSADGGPGTAGYTETYKTKPLTNGIVAERVSTKGLVRGLDLDEEIEKMGMSLDTLGMVNEFGVKRYLDAQGVWEKRFKDTCKGVAKQRRKQIDEAEKEDNSRFTKLKASVMARDTDDTEKNLLLNSAKWSWSWVVSGEENPPPSSIVARRDTTEARRLSKIADEAVEEKESRISGNNLWQIIVNSLTAGPEHPPMSPITSPKSPTWNSGSHFQGVQSPTTMDFERSGLERPASPARSSIFRASGLRSTSSLATSISNDVVRIRRPSFGSLRIGRGRYVDVNGDVLAPRQSVVPELPPALPSVGLGRDDTFTKLALEGIAEVRVSEDAPTSPLNTNGTKAPGASGAKNVLSPLTISPTAGGTNSALPTANGSGSGTSNWNSTTNGNGNGLTGPQRRGTIGTLGTPIKRKAIPAQLFEEAGIDPSQSPYASKESLTKLSNASQSKLPRTGSALSMKSTSGSLNGLQKEKAANATPPTPPLPSATLPNGDAAVPTMTGQ